MLAVIPLVVVKVRVEALLTVRPPVVGGGNDQTAHSQCQHTRGSLGDCHVEVLLHTIDSTEEEAHTHHQQQVGQHTTNEGGLYNKCLVLDQSDDCNNQLNSITAKPVRQMYTKGLEEETYPNDALSRPPMVSPVLRRH